MIAPSKLSLLIFAITAVVLTPFTFANVDISWSASVKLVQTAAGTNLPDGDVVYLGCFDGAGVSLLNANSQDVNLLKQHFFEIAEVRIGDNAMATPGAFSAVSTVLFQNQRSLAHSEGGSDTNTLSIAGGLKIYLWAFTGASGNPRTVSSDQTLSANATQTGLFSSTAPDWIITSDVNIATQAISTTDINQTFLGTDLGANAIRLEAVPEPSPLLIGIVGLSWLSLLRFRQGFVAV